MLCGIFYYAWYTMNWLQRTQRRLDPPLLGPYNNTHYGEVVLEHMRTMKSAGVDFVSVSWDPRKTHFEHVLDACEDTGMKMTVLYESLIQATGKNGHIEPQDHEAVLRDMEDLAEDLAEKCWLRIGGKPVVMFYVSRNYREPNEIFPSIREVLGDTYLVGDEMFWGRPSDPERIKHFDAITSYNWYQPGRFEGDTDREVCDSFARNVRDCVEDNIGVCADAGVPYWPVAMPGYDDRRVRPRAKHPPIPRLDGYFFERTLEDALATGPEAVMVTSWNEFYEDSQIEPCESYRELYLDILKGKLDGHA